MTRRTLLCVAIAGGALALPASSQSATNGTPEAELYIDVATHSMPGMPQLGGLGRAAMGMFGGGNHYGMTRFPAMPGQYLDVVVRVDVQQARRHPFAGGIDDVRASGVVEVHADRHDVSSADSDVPDRGRRAGSVEPTAIADDRVERRCRGHLTIEACRSGPCQ